MNLKIWSIIYKYESCSYLLRKYSAVTIIKVCEYKIVNGVAYKAGTETAVLPQKHGMLLLCFGVIDNDSNMTFKFV